MASKYTTAGDPLGLSHIEMKRVAADSVATRLARRVRQHRHSDARELAAEFQAMVEDILHTRTDDAATWALDALETLRTIPAEFTELAPARQALAKAADQRAAGRIVSIPEVFARLGVDPAIVVGKRDISPLPWVDQHVGSIGGAGAVPRTLA